MAISKHSLTVRMAKIGMAWATSDRKHVSPDDPMGDQMRGRKTYHVHPDKSEPRVSAIMRFDTLEDLAEYIDLREEYSEVRDDPSIAAEYILFLEDELRQF